MKHGFAAPHHHGHRTGQVLARHRRFKNRPDVPDALRAKARIGNLAVFN
jgi:hypothetical protein